MGKLNIEVGQIWQSKKAGTQVRVEKIEAGQIIFSFSSGHFATQLEDSFKELHELVLEPNKPKEVVVKADKFEVDGMDVSKVIARSWGDACIKAIDGLVTPKENLSKPDMVNKPPHYKDASGIECKEITCHRKMPFSLGNAIKYLYRAGSKGDLLEDLKKAEWYLRVAYLNDERVPKAVEVRLLEVAAHRKTAAGGALNLISLHEIEAAYQVVKSEIEKLEAGSD